MIQDLKQFQAWINKISPNQWREIYRKGGTRKIAETAWMASRKRKKK